MNEVVYQLASFMLIRSATPWRWSHTRHHTDTIIVGCDPEIANPRPPAWRVLLLEIFRLYIAPRDLKPMIFNCFGKVDDEVKTYLPPSQFRKAFWEARVYLLILLAVVAACIYSGSIMPAMFIGLPSFYGTPFVILFAVTQHAGLHEDVLDHRLNTRSVYMNPFFGLSSGT